MAVVNELVLESSFRVVDLQRLAMKSVLSFLERRKLFLLPLAWLSILIFLASHFSNQDGTSWPAALRTSTSTSPEGSWDTVTFAFITIGLDSAKEAGEPKDGRRRNHFNSKLTRFVFDSQL